MDYFDHEKMDVYKVAIEFIALADEVAEDLPRGRAYLTDQLRRACTSVALNIAEGAGEFSGDEKARFYRMAKRSATECAAVLDICRRLALADGTRLHAGRELLLRIVSMLIPLIRRASNA
jgi:four helix bundle protein